MEICLRCGNKFIDENYDKNLPLAKRIYCNKCLNELEKEKNGRKN